jgi:hypothetical protein
VIRIQMLTRHHRAFQSGWPHYYREQAIAPKTQSMNAYGDL